jgi:hypothetical protein
VRMSNLTGTALVQGDEAETATEFARLAAVGLAQFEPEELGDRSLVLVFAMSAWLRLARTSIAGACAALLQLRHLLLDSSRLDQVSEPVPLLAGEPRTALLGLATYVHGLICRAAANGERSRAALVEEALAHLD